MKRLRKCPAVAAISSNPKSLHSSILVQRLQTPAALLLLILCLHSDVVSCQQCVPVQQLVNNTQSQSILNAAFSFETRTSDRLAGNTNPNTFILPSDDALARYSTTKNITLASMLLRPHALNNLLANAIVPNTALNLATMVGQNITTLANVTWQVVALPSTNVTASALDGVDAASCPFALQGPNNTLVTFKQCNQPGSSTCQQAVYITSNAPLLSATPNVSALPATTAASSAFATTFPLPPGSPPVCNSMLDTLGRTTANTTLFQRLLSASKLGWPTSRRGLSGTFFAPDDDAIRGFLQRTNTTLDQIIGNRFVLESLVFAHFAAPTIRPRQALAPPPNNTFTNYGISPLRLSWVDARNATLNTSVTAAPNCNGLSASLGVANSSSNTPVRQCVPGSCAGMVYVIGGVLVDAGLDAYIRAAGPGLQNAAQPQPLCESMQAVLFYKPDTSVTNWIVETLLGLNGTLNATVNSTVNILNTRGSFMAVSDDGWLRASAQLRMPIDQMLSQWNQSLLVGIMQYHVLPNTTLSDLARRNSSLAVATALGNETVTVVPDAARTCPGMGVQGGLSNATVTQCNVGNPCGGGSLYLINNVLLPNLLTAQLPNLQGAALVPTQPITG